MTTRSRTAAAALAAASALAVAATGCGGDVPEGSVAKVNDATIARSEFDHWLGAAARSQQPPGPGGQAVVPDPPDYEQCVASLEEQVQAGGQQQPSAPSPEQLKQACEQQYESLKEQVMQFLIQAEAIQQEAAARGIELPEAEVAQQYEELKEQSFPKDDQFQEFLETSGRTEGDLLFQVRLDLLSTKIRDEVVAEGVDVSDPQIQAYYEDNKEQPPIGEPEQRDIDVVLTRDEAEANSALEQLEKGESFAKVAKKFSIDEASSSKGGRLEGIQEGEQEMALDEAVFGAEEGELVGPIETEFGFYVFEVTDITPAESQTLEESRGTITDLLRSQREQEALNDFIEDFQARYTEETACAEGFVTQGCKGAPAPDPTQVAPGAPPGGAPQGTPPQGVPPQGAPPQGVPPGGGAPPGQGAVPPDAGVPPDQAVPPQGAPGGGAPDQQGGGSP